MNLGSKLQPLKIALVCSHGGHLTEMLQFLESFNEHEVFFYCYDAPTTRVLKNVYTVPNMARNPIEFIRNLFRVYKIFLHERPDLLISTGAEIAIPAAIIAKLMGIPILYIECGAQVFTPSFTGRIMYWLADRFYVQWLELLEKYGARASFRGSLIDEDRPFEGDKSYLKLKKVTLVHPAFKSGFASEQPPMGLAYLASVLQQEGCEVRVIDANVEHLSEEETLYLLIAQSPDIVCVTVTTPLVPYAVNLAKKIRDTRIDDFNPILIAGGPHATVLPEDLLGENSFDIVVRGEGEKILREVLRALIEKTPLEGIDGISYRAKNGEIIHNLCSKDELSLEHIPRPDWSLFPIRKYSSPVRLKSFSLPILTSRGCPHRCVFCYKGVFGNQIRFREPEDVVKEWEFLVRRYKVEEIAVIDDVFTENSKRVKEICGLLVKNKLNRIPWSTTNGIRVNNVTFELLSVMKAAGCYRVYFGVESGVQEIVDALGKNISLKQVATAVEIAKSCGLEVGLYFMLGNLGDTEETMEQTIEFAIKLDPDWVQFTIATPYPGTKMYEEINKKGKFLVQSWEEFASYKGLIFEYGELTPRIVNQKYQKAYRRFYFRPRFIAQKFRYFLSYERLKLALKVLIFSKK